jgi:uncharacterized iron-regulated protein
MKFAIGWEMFDETQQSSIDAWASHQISLEELMAKTGFQKRWGVYSPVYEQILRTTNKANVRNIALNAPDELARRIARGEPLTSEELAMLPSGFATDEGGYRNFVAMMGEHPGVEERDRRRYFEAQNAWDETMASRILEFKRRNPKLKLVVFTGRDHVSGGYGIPFYVSQKADLKQLVLFPKGRLDLGPGSGVTGVRIQELQELQELQEFRRSGGQEVRRSGGQEVRSYRSAGVSSGVEEEGPNRPPHKTTVCPCKKA